MAIAWGPVQSVAASKRRPQGLPRLSSTTGDDHQSVVGQGPLKHQRLFRDPAPPAFRPVRGFGGGGARRHSNRTKDLDNVAQKAVIKQAPPGRFKAGSCPRDAPSETGHNHCRRYTGNRLAAKASWKTEICDCQDSRKSDRLNDPRF